MAAPTVTIGNQFDKSEFLIQMQKPPGNPVALYVNHDQRNILGDLKPVVGGT